MPTVSFLRASLICSALLCGGALGARAQCAGPADADAVAPATTTESVRRDGDVSYVARADGSSAVWHHSGDTANVSDTREGMSGVAHLVGDVVFLHLQQGQWMCTAVSAQLYCAALGAQAACPAASLRPGLIGLPASHPWMGGEPPRFVTRL